MPTINALSKNKKNIIFFYQQNIILYSHKNHTILHRHVNILFLKAIADMVGNH